ncbi:MAG TPA: sulfatase [Candidatus Binatia bacterium]|nr:sulfatase [Candidatus Binatia bacterium]
MSAVLRLALVVVALEGAVGCSSPAPARPNIVVIVVDTLRADRLGTYGSSRNLTPFLDGLAARGAVFEHAFAPSAWTNPSVASLLTSRYPSQHHVSNFDSKLGDDEVTFAERLTASGWEAAGFSANFQLAAANGYAQGFATWRTFPETFKLRGPGLRRACVEWLDGGARRVGAPLLLYLQFMEPHAPYEPPPPFRERFALPERSGVSAAAANHKLLGLDWGALSADEVALLASLYDAEVAAADAELRALFDDLDARGVLRSAIVVVTADHGEEFREHGFLAHGVTLYQTVLHVPLLFIGPGIPAGRRVRENVSLIDLAPTLLDLAGLPAEPRFEGRSLRPAFYGFGIERDVLAELPPWQEGTDWRQHAAALVRGPFKLLARPPNLRRAFPPVIYDLARDPREEHPDPLDLAIESEILQHDLRAEVAALAARAGTAERRGLSEEERARLRALGYIE